jgi:hypothetical protein
MALEISEVHTSNDRHCRDNYRIAADPAQVSTMYKYNRPEKSITIIKLRAVAELVRPGLSHVHTVPLEALREP